MKQTLLLVLTTILFLNCTTEETNESQEKNFDCFNNELEIITSKYCCDAEPSFLVCEILKVNEINRLEEESYSWLPNACSSLNSRVIFKSNNEETNFTLLDRRHYVLHEQFLMDCNENFEKGTYIEQYNEIITLAYLNEFFGSDTIYIQLRSIINSYENQTPHPKVDFYSILHRKSNTSIAKFYFRQQTNGSRFDPNSGTFHDSIELKGVEYNSVFEFKTYPNVNLEEYVTLYINKQFGFFGFEKDQIVWIKED